MSEIQVITMEPLKGKCFCLWKVGVPCPNRPEWRIQNTTNTGYSLMCTPHKEGFAAAYPYAAVRYLAYDEPTPAAPGEG